ncbi:DUF5060 domain-containing protein [Bythopirellula polymerisocia]|uniref:Beta-L-arabinobiosidase n=1 Tax=Bythopirellula polymerisocia TaxID=2528003 RepID=A0A5C6CYI1_9BACT|nr:DUF5060 domain-containing protein [Bythopirellula polymerisocia]TWU28644.1 Beta-L-arabinobiosidase precursor [Bythopirellula polymerisocia]
MKRLISLGFCFVSFVFLLGLSAKGEGTSISGELRQWHKVTLTIDGPQASEDGDLNPFLDYRMQVTFRHPASGLTYNVPGYFAADGDAANSSATLGTKWRAHLSPDHSGEWTYTVSFREGPGVAISDDPNAGTAVDSVDGLMGSFEVSSTDKSGRDFRGKGRLNYVGKHHLQFAGTGEFFLKTGVDAPENFLAYQDFDGEFKKDGQKDNLIKDWGPHVQDWQTSDPTWQNGKGKGIIGAINYLASQGLNSFSFITLNINGDDRNVFPYTTYDERARIDCSRMDQWETLFAHGDKLGMYLHFKTQEAENVNLLDNAKLGLQRKLYYRELIARFGHHLALNWNLGEEIGLYNKVSTEEKVAWADYFWSHDPYQHHIVIHNGDNHFDLLGDASALTGFSLQTNQPDFRYVHARTLQYIRRSAAAGKPWVVACDEPGDAMHSLLTDAEDPTHDDPRKNALWGNLMAGGAGVEWYFGYKHPHSDLTCQDFRVRQNMWKQCRQALDFFRHHRIPFWNITNANEKLATKDAYCLCEPGKLYLVYLKQAKQASLDLSDANGLFEVLWFNPRHGGPLHLGSTQAVIGGGKVMIGKPPTEPEQDWLAVVRLGDPDRDYPPRVSAGIDNTIMLPRNSDTVTLRLQGDVGDVGKSAARVTSMWTKISGPGEVKFADATALDTQVTFSSVGQYVLKLAATDGSQHAETDVTITVEPFQPKATQATTSNDASVLSAMADFKFVISGEFVRGYKDKKQRALAINAAQHRNKFAAAETTFQGNAGIYDLVLTTLTETDGASTYRLLVDGRKVGEARNPDADRDYESVMHRFNGVSLKPGDKIRVEFNSDTNGLIPEGNGFAFSRGRWRSLTFLKPGTPMAQPKRNANSGQTSTSDQTKANIPPFEFKYDPTQAKKVHKQSQGIVVVEAEDYDAVDRQHHRKWYRTSSNKTPEVKPDPDPNHAEGASGGAYLEILPDTRVTHADPLVNGVSFSNTPGQCSVLYYPVIIEKPGRYYVWVRTCCTGSEDNGLHVGIDGQWPTSGARLQFRGQHGRWQWDSRQRTEEVHTGVLGQIWLDIEEPGLHTIMFSMREDGFEFDKFLLTRYPKPMKSKTNELGPAASPLFASSR